MERQDPEMYLLSDFDKSLIKGLHYRIEWIPREENEEADKLTRIANSG
jgi:hypothetical protein